MHKILKYALTYQRWQSLAITRPYEIVFCACQEDIPTIWIKQKMKSKESVRLIIGLYATGESITMGAGVSIGAIVNSSSEIYHLFDEGWTVL